MTPQNIGCIWVGPRSNICLLKNVFKLKTFITSQILKTVCYNSHQALHVALQFLKTLKFNIPLQAFIPNHAPISPIRPLFQPPRTIVTSPIGMLFHPPSVFMDNLDLYGLEN